jgi:hypothetical protein
MVLALIDVLLNSDMYMPHSNLFPIDNYPKLRAIDVDITNDLKMVGVYSHIHTKNRNNPLHMWLYDVVKQALNEQINK